MADYTLEGVKWAGAPATVTWSFAAANYADRGYQFASFFDPSIAPAVRQALARWSGVADITFKQVADGDGADIRFGLNPIDGAYGTVGITSYEALAARDGSGTSPLRQADIEFDSDEGWHAAGGRVTDAAGDITLYAVALHEIGHALGLDHYTGGTAIMNPVLDATDLTASDIHGIQALYGPGYFDPSATRNAVDVTTPGTVVHSTADDAFRNHGTAGTTFVFEPGYGHDLVAGFVAAGAGHDALSLPSADFADIADVLRHTQNTGGGAVIHDPAAGDTIWLVGVSKAELAQNRAADISLHG